MEIMKMEIAQGRDYIKWYDEDQNNSVMSNRLFMAGIHGVDVRDQEPYSSFIKKANDEKYEIQKKKYKHRLDKEIPMDEEIQSIIEKERNV